MPPNQNPEQAARDRIDAMLAQCGWVVRGWVVQDKKTINFNAGPGIAVREYQTDVGPADYVLFVDQQAVGVIEGKKVRALGRFSPACVVPLAATSTHFIRLRISLK